MADDAIAGVVSGARNDYHWSQPQVGWVCSLGKGSGLTPRRDGRPQPDLWLRGASRWLPLPLEATADATHTHTANPPTHLGSVPRSPRRGGAVAVGAPRVAVSRAADHVASSLVVRGWCGKARVMGQPGINSSPALAGATAATTTTQAGVGVRRGNARGGRPLSAVTSAVAAEERRSQQRQQQQALSPKSPSPPSPPPSPSPHEPQRLAAPRVRVQFTPRSRPRTAVGLHDHDRRGAAATRPGNSERRSADGGGGGGGTLSTVQPAGRPAAAFDDGWAVEPVHFHGGTVRPASAPAAAWPGAGAGRGVRRPATAAAQLQPQPQRQRQQQRPRRGRAAPPPSAGAAPEASLDDWLAVEERGGGGGGGARGGSWARGRGGAQPRPRPWVGRGSAGHQQPLPICTLSRRMGQLTTQAEAIAASVAAKMTGGGGGGGG
eukprot:COSAG01_NODE_2971_length_6775_cov_5.071001_5_plen_433_part_01